VSAADRKRIKTSHPGVYYREGANGRTYIVWYQGTDGKARFENVQGGERDAVKARAKIIDRMAHGYKVQPSRLKMKDYSIQWLEGQHHRPKTMSTYKWAIDRHIVPQLGWRRVSEMDVHKVAGFIAHMKKEGYKAWTINNALTPLRLILKRAVRDGLIAVDPFPLLERNERPKADQRKMEILDTDEIQMFLGAATDWYRPLLATALFTGMRRGELLNLKWSEVDLDDGIIHVTDSKTAAGVREVILIPSLEKILRRHKLAQHQGATYVFETHEGRQMRGDVVLKGAMKATLARSGVQKDLRLHDLRHTHASILIHQGQTDQFICEQLGHASAAITRRIYGHLFDREARREDAKARLEAEFGNVLKGDQ
jgi:integrase